MSDTEKITELKGSQDKIALKSLNAKKKVQQSCGLSPIDELILQEYEGFWRAIYIAVSAMSAFLMGKVYRYQTAPEFQADRKGNVTQLLVYGLSATAFFVLLEVAVHWVLDDWFQEHVLTEERYEGEQARKKRSYTLVKWAHSMVFYLGSAIISYNLIKDTSFFPRWLGGTGSSDSLFIECVTLSEATYGMKIYYIVQFGKHLGRTISHMFIRTEGNYYEYLLHHALSTFLIMFSYLTNMWLIGIMVLFCHDISDFSLLLSRFYKDTKFCNKMILKGIYVYSFIMWVGMRIFVFPITCIFSGVISFYSNFLYVADPLTVEIMTVPYCAMLTMMGLLMILHLFWTYYILQSFVSVNISKGVTHNYD